MSSSRAELIRGAFSVDEDNSRLKHGVPTFTTKQEAVDWCQLLADEKGNLNPQLRHAITTFVGWREVEEFLLPRLSKPMLPPSGPPVTPEERDRTRDFPDEVVRELQWRLKLPHHVKLSQVSSLNTLRYSFFQMRCGILVQIRNNQLYTFAPFVNDQYRNNWGNDLRTDYGTDFAAYAREKLRHYRKENVLPDRNTWWANGNIICNEHDSSRSGVTQWWSDNMLMPFKHMLETACRERRMPDVDFFFNKRDHPQLRVRADEEPYDFMFPAPSSTPALLPPAFRFGMLTPFLSFYCGEQFSDLPCPTVEDWKNAIGMVFPETTIETGLSTNPVSDLYLEENFSQLHVPWENKTDTAFFRGNATGGGVTPANNQRLHLAALSAREWKQIKEEEGLPPLLDARVTGFNVRDKKLKGEPMRFCKTNELKDLKGGFVPMYKQGTYKYVCYVEGHCAANRYAFLMRLGSVILKIESTCAASELWFFPLLRPQLDVDADIPADDAAALAGVTADHVPVKADLSDLEQKIRWCRRNDAACRRITENALKLYNRILSREAILNYWEVLVGEMAKNRFPLPAFYQPASPVPPTAPQVQPTGQCCDPRTRQWCTRCKEERDQGGGGGGMKRPKQ